MSIITRDNMMTMFKADDDDNALTPFAIFCGDLLRGWPRTTTDFSSAPPKKLNLPITSWTEALQDEYTAGLFYMIFFPCLFAFMCLMGWLAFCMLRCAFDKCGGRKPNVEEVETVDGVDIRKPGIFYGYENKERIVHISLLGIIFFIMLTLVMISWFSATQTSVAINEYFPASDLIIEQLYKIKSDLTQTQATVNAPLELLVTYESVLETQMVRSSDIEQCVTHALNVSNNVLLLEDLDYNLKNIFLNNILVPLYSNLNSSMVELGWFNHTLYDFKTNVSVITSTISLLSTEIETNKKISKNEISNVMSAIDAQTVSYSILTMSDSVINECMIENNYLLDLGMVVNSSIESINNYTYYINLFNNTIGMDNTTIRNELIVLKDWLNTMIITDPELALEQTSISAINNMIDNKNLIINYLHNIISNANDGLRVLNDINNTVFVINDYMSNNNHNSFQFFKYMYSQLKSTKDLLSISYNNGRNINQQLIDGEKETYILNNIISNTMEGLQNLNNTLVEMLCLDDVLVWIDKINIELFQVDNDVMKLFESSDIIKTQLKEIESMKLSITDTFHDIKVLSNVINDYILNNNNNNTYTSNNLNYGDAVSLSSSSWINFTSISNILEPSIYALYGPYNVSMELFNEWNDLYSVMIMIENEFSLSNELVRMNEKLNNIILECNNIDIILMIMNNDMNVMNITKSIPNIFNNYTILNDYIYNTINSIDFVLISLTNNYNSSVGLTIVEKEVIITTIQDLMTYSGNLKFDHDNYLTSLILFDVILNSTSESLNYTSISIEYNDIYYNDQIDMINLLNSTISIYDMTLLNDNFINYVPIKVYNTNDVIGDINDIIILSEMKKVVNNINTIYSIDLLQPVKTVDYAIYRGITDSIVNMTEFQYLINNQSVISGLSQSSNDISDIIDNMYNRRASYYYERNRLELKAFNYDELRLISCILILFLPLLLPCCGILGGVTYRPSLPMLMALTAFPLAAFFFILTAIHAPISLLLLDHCNDFKHNVAQQLSSEGLIINHNQFNVMNVKKDWSYSDAFMYFSTCDSVYEPEVLMQMIHNKTEVLAYANLNLDIISDVFLTNDYITLTNTMQTELNTFHNITQTLNDYPDKISSHLDCKKTVHLINTYEETICSGLMHSLALNTVMYFMIALFLIPLIIVGVRASKRFNQRYSKGYMELQVRIMKAKANHNFNQDPSSQSVSSVKKIKRKSVIDATKAKGKSHTPRAKQSNASSNGGEKKRIRVRRRPSTKPKSGKTSVSRKKSDIELDEITIVDNENC